MEIICIILVAICLIIFVAHKAKIEEMHTYYENQKKNLKKFYAEDVKQFEQKLKQKEKELEEVQKEKAKLVVDSLEMKKELSKIEERRRKRKMLPRRPKTKNRTEIEADVKSYLAFWGIDCTLKNPTNSLLKVYEGMFEIYCVPENYMNKITKTKGRGLKNMVKEIRKIEKEKNKNENK